MIPLKRPLWQIAVPLASFGPIFSPRWDTPHLQENLDDLQMAFDAGLEVLGWPSFAKWYGCDITLSGQLDWEISLTLRWCQTCSTMKECRSGFDVWFLTKLERISPLPKSKLDSRRLKHAHRIAHVICHLGVGRLLRTAENRPVHSLVRSASNESSAI